VWLGSDRQQAEIANGLRYGVFADSKDSKTKKVKLGTGVRELTSSVAPGLRPEDKERLVSASSGDGVPKAAWRELHSIAVLRRAGKRGGPAALEHMRSERIQEARLWCGALVGDQAKVGDIVESVFRLPVEFLEDADPALEDDPRKCPGPNRTYRRGVALADEWARRLQSAVREYHAKLKGNKVKSHAAMRYWTSLEQLAEPLLLHKVAIHSDLYWSNNANWMNNSPWGREVWKAAHDAYEFACPHGTPRQLRAYAAGLAVLRREGLAKSAAAKNADEHDSNAGGEE
jgi:hypothetical protein